MQPFSHPHIQHPNDLHQMAEVQKALSLGATWQQILNALIQGGLPILLQLIQQLLASQGLNPLPISTPPVAP